ncbi:MAG: NAD(P)-dependent oxidoreductase [Deltaproteobacteria bacterium]|nr:NAD(P)-dependent oxidoreductase [Deltaproteobacteria bacterium]
MGEKVFLTGGSGFLGSHIADELSTRGFDVTVFDRRPSPWLRPGQTMLIGDLLDVDLLGRHLEGVRHVYHLGALADLNAAIERPLDTVRVNILGTVGLLEAARRASIDRFVFASTVYVYSREGGFYRCSKQACESYIEQFGRQYGLRYTILRYGSLYGPRSNESNGVYRLLKMAIDGATIHYKGLPSDIREYIHVEDAAKLSVDVLAPEYAGRHLVLTGHAQTRAEDLFKMFSEILGRPVRVEYPRESDASHYSITPYAYTPRPGTKLTTNEYVDMGQGVLQVVEQIAKERGSFSPGP